MFYSARVYNIKRGKLSWVFVYTCKLVNAKLQYHFNGITIFIVLVTQMNNLSKRFRNIVIIKKGIKENKSIEERNKAVVKLSC